MANKKISELTSINNPTLNAITPIVLSNITYKTTLQNLRQVLVDNGSHVFTGSQKINGNLEIFGSLTANQYIISSSYINIITENISGSTSFGNTEDDTHKFTGSLSIQGPLTVDGRGRMTNLIVGFGELHETNPEVLHAESSGSFNIAHYQGDFESYAQINLKNINSGNGASGDIVITADNGTEEIHYVDLGINSSTYTAGYVGYENDAYLINAGKDLYLGTIGGLEDHPSRVHIFTNNNWENSQIILSPTREISFNTSSVSSGFTYEFSGSVKLQNDISVDGLLKINSVVENVTVSDGDIDNINLDFSSGSIFYITNLTGSGTWNVNNIPEDNNKAITLTFVIEQGLTPYSASIYQINNSTVPIKWVDNIIPTGSSNRTDIVGLTAFRINSNWNVLGSLSTF